jgi:hypothetical protein
MLRKLGDRWLKEAISAALKDPSAVIPLEFNYLLIPRHLQLTFFPINASKALFALCRSASTSQL